MWIRWLPPWACRGVVAAGSAYYDLIHGSRGGWLTVGLFSFIFRAPQRSGICNAGGPIRLAPLTRRLQMVLPFLSVRAVAELKLPRKSSWASKLSELSRYRPPSGLPAAFTSCGTTALSLGAIWLTCCLVACAGRMGQGAKASTRSRDQKRGRRGNQRVLGVREQLPCLFHGLGIIRSTALKLCLAVFAPL